MTLTEAAAQAEKLAQSGSERELATLRQQWDEEVESAARSADYRQRAVAYRAIGQFRFRQKLELLRRGLDDDSPAVRGLAIVCLRNGSPQRETIVLLNGLAESDDEEHELRQAARTVAADLKKRAGARS